jgi:hypothetical protein
MRRALLIGVIALSACGPTDRRPADAPAPSPTSEPAPPSDSPKPSPGGDECGAGKLGAYVNQLPSAEAMTGIRTTIGHDRIRTIKPGDAVTMDYRPDRLNIELGEDGRIKVVRCG